MHRSFTSTSKSSARLHVVTSTDAKTWLEDQPNALKAFAQTSAFTGAAGQIVQLSNSKGELTDVLLGAGDGDDALVLAFSAARLPSGDYAPVTLPENLSLAQACAGWADGAYRFEAYKTSDTQPPRLVVENEEVLKAADIQARAIDLARDLINTPAQDMAPSHIAAAALALATEFGAEATVIIGDDLLAQNYPMVHAVGRAAADAPRYVEFVWGRDDAPKLALVGKGVAFDTGGLNLKTGNYMRLMKKDMGGAAHALALARMVMESGLDVRLSVHIPTVENAVSGDAFRPGDVLDSRKGLSVEIDNTDAEGRLILADALTRACELEPELIIDFATLTGAARTAMGPDIVPFFTHDDTLAGQLTQASMEEGDPIWRLPLWKPYQKMLASPIADVVNGAASPFAGCITAALFLDRFVDGPSWAHFDVWGWRQGKYGRPEGGAAMALRAVLKTLQTRYGG